MYIINMKVIIIEKLNISGKCFFSVQNIKHIISTPQFRYKYRKAYYNEGIKITEVEYGNN